MSKSEKYCCDETNKIALNAFEKKFYNSGKYRETYNNKASNLMICAATILTFQGAIGTLIIQSFIEINSALKIIFIISFILPLILYGISIHYSVKSYEFILVSNFDPCIIQKSAEYGENQKIITEKLIKDYIKSQNVNTEKLKPTTDNITESIKFLKFGIYATIMYLVIMGIIYILC